MLLGWGGGFKGMPVANARLGGPDEWKRRQRPFQIPEFKVKPDKDGGAQQEKKSQLAKNVVNK